ncbi:EGF domain-containing protein [Myxococcus fulvus]|uniref:EGF domain-containing protein n=1 Tax=Myxococcus fulvus TaxID=33 RepID=UPI003B9BDBB7
MTKYRGGSSRMMPGLALMLGLLGACDGGSGEDVPARPSSLAHGEQALSAHPYANEVEYGTTVAVRNPDAALGAPDGKAATLLTVLGTALLLDMGEMEVGHLEVHYRGLTVAVVTQVDFYGASRDYLGTGYLHLVGLDEGPHVSVVRNPRQLTPFRYVRLRGILGVYGVDAVKALGGNQATCGDGSVGGTEACDDGNTQAGDGCGADCQVEPGYSCQGTEPSVCADIDECTLGTDDCTLDEVCVNTPGGFECQAPEACEFPYSVCGTACVDLRLDDNHCGDCDTVCGAASLCARSDCVEVGDLRFSASWGREGDADLLVRTPTGKTVSFFNRGPSEATDFGLLAGDVARGQGPETVFWARGQTPPRGTYVVCLLAQGFDPPMGETAPVDYTLRIRSSGQDVPPITGRLSAPPASFECTEDSEARIGSFTWQPSP